MEIRRLTLDDHVASFRLGAEAFGSPPYAATPGDPPTSLPVGREVWGAFVGGELVARVAAHEYESWFHGRRVPTCGIAGVTVAAEHRGAGLLAPVFDAALGAAAERGEALSTLFPTANGIYRSLGYELVGSLDTVRLSTAEAAAVRAPTATTTRRATAADVPTVKALYDTWAAAQNGPLTRTGPRFATSDEDLVGAFTAITLAVEGDRVVGYAMWDRGEGYDPSTSVLEVHDLVAVTSDGYRALWRVLGSHTSVAGRLTLDTSGDDPARLVLPTATWEVVSRHPYMLRVSDPAAALTGIASPGITAEVPFAVAGETFLLTLGDEPSTCEPTTTGDGPTFTPQGLAMAYAGTQSCANLRMSGHLSGPATYDAVLDALLGARQPHIRDYF